MIERFIIILKDLGLDASLFFAGSFGSLMSVSKGKQKTPWENILALISGAGCANYLTPVFTTLSPVLSSAELGVAFLVGFGGFKTVEILYDRVTKNIDDNQNNQNGEI